MYYTSTDKRELEAYDALVTQGEGYDGIKTTNWAKVVEHPNGGLYAILANSKYESELDTIPALSEDWFPEEIL